MIDVNRRDLLAIAASGSLISACGTQAGDESHPTKAHISKFAETFGRNPDYGQDPASPSTTPTAFKPKAICVVYMKFEGAKLKSKHAFFPISSAGKTPEEHQQFAESRLIDMRGAWPTGIRPLREGSDFADFSFGSRQKVFMFIDNGTDVRFDSFNKLRFSKFAALPDSDGNPVKMRKNASFMGANVIEGIASLKNQQLLYVENWFQKFKNDDDESKGKDDLPTNPAGTPPKPADINSTTYIGHSMNIHLIMKTTMGNDISLVIDPTTGNGGGAEP